MKEGNRDGVVVGVEGGMEEWYMLVVLGRVCILVGSMLQGNGKRGI